MGEREPGDELRVEIGEMSGPARRPGAGDGPRSPLEPRRTPRRRAVGMLATAGIALLALATVLASLPAVRRGAGGVVSGLLPTPTPTLTPGGNRFYLLPEPPGVVVSLDGQVVARPTGGAGDAHPLVLAPGRHTFAWRSTGFPFQPQRCTVWVPQRPGAETCPLGAVDPSAGGGYVVLMRDALNTLAAPQAQALRLAIQTAVEATQFAAIVRAGEAYSGVTPDGTTQGIVTAPQPLRATLGYAVDPNVLAPEPCVGGSVDIPCRFPDQECYEICTVPPSQAAGIGAAGEWIAGIGAFAFWSYTTLDGRGVAGVPSPSNGQLMILRIGWDGAGWHVAPVFGHTATLPATDDAACDDARFQLAQTTWSFMLNNPPLGESARFASDASPADGCVAVLEHGQPAIFLERFGALVTVNDWAVNPTDALPVADAAEQALAAQLAAQLGP